MKTNTFIFFLSVIISIYTLQCFAGENKTLIIFSADWCQYCQVAKNDINVHPELSETVKQYDVIVVDYDKDKDIVQVHNIKTIPAFLIYDKGKEQGRLIGYKGPQQLNSFLK
jgi:thiol-disulfide isomerase/thioredoxin